jgi:predicted membrane protein
MNLKFQLTQEDLVKFNEYHSAHSLLHIKNRRRYRIVVPIIYIVLSGIFFVLSEFIMGVIFILFALVWFLLAPWRQRRRYKKHFQKHVAETVGNALEEPTEIELKEDGIHGKSHIGSSIFKYSSVDKIINEEGYTYIYIGKGMALIIPHDRVPAEDISTLIAEIEKQKISEPSQLRLS